MTDGERSPARGGGAGTPVRVAFIITGLNTGGAEMMLLKLLSDASRADLVPCVVSLSDHGTIGSRLAELGIPVHALGLSSLRMASAGGKLRSILREFRPHLVQGWMYHGNVAASIARSFRWVRCPVLWSVRQSLYDLSREKPGTAATIRAGAWLSGRSPRAIIYNSHVAARQHEELGYASGRTTVIPNGFDMTVFAPRAEARRASRHLLGIPDGELVIGLSARFHPMKNHANFLRAGALLASSGRKVRCVLVGKGTELANPEMAALVRESGIGSALTTLGERSDVADLYNAFDVACSSSSWGEGFANSIGEAMSCGVPCVVTDVGDSAMLVGDTGRVVPPDRPDVLAQAIGLLADAGAEERNALGFAARERVRRHFSIAAVVDQYLTLFRDTAAGTLRASRNMNV